MSDGPEPFPFDNVIPGQFKTRYDELDDLLRAIKDEIYKYADRVPVATVLGVLRIIEHDLIRDLQEDA